MLNERLAAAKPIATSLKLAEAALNEALLHMGDLLGNVAKARSAKGTRFALTAGLDASEMVSLAASNAITSFKQIIEAHGHLANDRENSGLPTVAFGDVYCEASGQLDQGTGAPLRVVGE